MSERSTAAQFQLPSLPFLLWNAALFLVLLCVLASGNLLRGQSTERRSYIVRTAPGTEVKEVMEQVASVAPSLASRIDLQPVISSGKSNTLLLSEHRLDRYLVIEFDSGDAESAIESLLDRVEGIEAFFPNHSYRVHADPPDDSLYGDQWALEKIGAIEAWEITEGKSDVLVGVLDTGIEWEHADLRDALWINSAEDRNGNGRFDAWADEEIRDGVSGDLDGVDQDGNGYPDDVIGFDFVDQDVPNVGDWSGRDGVPGDDEGHGTNVSGVIAATKNNAIGVAGIAPGTRLVTLRSFDGTGNGQDDDIAAAIVYAADRGVSVLNMSFGDFYRSPLMYDAVRYAYDKGVLLIASSGNDGVSDPHYPSGFSEVVSVGATDSADRLSFFSTFGSQLSLVAPGVDIITTGTDGGYDVVDGTSFSSPYVAGVAALVRGLHPDWKHDEVAASIEAATDDLGAPGWDENFGAGRLNAAAAVRSPGPPILEIFSPLMDEGIDRDMVIAIDGAAVGPLLLEWHLDVGKGGLPEEWTRLAESNEGTIGSLGSLNTTLFPDTLLTIRLTLVLTNGRTVERRTRFFLDRTPPTQTDFRMRNVWRFERRALALTFHSDDMTRGTVWVRPAGESGRPYLPIELEPERVGLTRVHYYFLTDLELDRGKPYDLYVELVNAAGGRSFIGSPEDPLSAEIEEAAFPVETMERQNWTLPYSFSLNERVDLTGDGAPEIVLNRFDRFAFSNLFLYEFDNDAFVPIDSAGNWIPRGVGDSDGDGLREVLGQSSRTGIVYEQTSANGSPFASIMFADTMSGRFYPGAFYDFDDDGRDELVGYTSEHDSTEQYYFIAAWDGTKYAEQARMPNATLPERGFARNFMGASDAIMSDFNNNGKVDILFGDDDGDFMIYERESTNVCKLLWVEETDGEEGDRLIAAGDLDADGVDEVIIAYRSPGATNADHEYEPPLWTLRVVSLAGGGATELTREEFAYVRSSNPFRPGLEAADLDGEEGAEIALSVFPSMYVLRWDAQLRRLRPFWWRENSIINRPITQDFNQDGVNELGFGDGDLIRFFQIDPDRQAPAPPAGAYGWALNDSTAYIDWEPVPEAERYHVYRALLDAAGPISFVRIATTDSTQFLDTGFGTGAGRLDANREYGYIVTAVDDASVDTESRGSKEVVVYTHAPVKAIRAEQASPREIRVEMSGRVSDKLYRSGALQVLRDGTPLPVSSVFTVGERTVLVALYDEVYESELTIRPTELFRDFYDTPADTTAVVTVTMAPRDDSEPFIATHAVPLEGKVIAIEFSDEVEVTSGTDRSNYTLDPSGEIVSITIDPNDPRRVLLTLDPSYPLGPFGYEYLVTIRNVRASDGRSITTGAGSVVGFTISADDLEELFVYPHPFSLSRDAQVTFAGLTQRSTIRIYTQSGALLREIESNSGDGGASWDGSDARGRKLPTGVYLYSVVARSLNGVETESRLRKIAIVP